MRYESFYPFARQQQSPFSRPQGFGPPMSMGPPMPPQQRGLPPTGTQGGYGQNLPGGSKMEGYMQTANQFLNTAQQFAPLIQQFAPMVQNLPAMWRLYKGFQSLPDAGGLAASGTPPAAGTAASNAASTTANNAPRIFQPPF